MLKPTMAAAFLLMGVADSAAAQSVPSPFVNADAILLRADVAGVRAIPGFAPPGVRLGGLVLRPELALRAAADSNILNLQSKEGDVALLVEPRVRLASDWRRHSLSVGADARIARFADITSENSETYGGDLRGVLDLGPGAALSGALRAGRRLEARGAGGTSLPDTGPTLYDEVGASLGVPLGAGRLRVILSGGWSERRYLDLETPGAPLDQSFRDQRLITFGSRAELALNPALRLFASAGLSESRSLEAVEGQSRDADGQLYLAGVAGDLAPLVTGEVAAGWRRRDFRELGFVDYDGLVFDLRLDWYPSPLVSLAVAAGQDFANSGIVDDPAILQQSAEVRGYYELRRNVLVGAEVRYRHDRFRQIRESADQLEMGVRTEWRLAPRFALAARLGWRDRSVSDPDQLAAYSGVQASIGIETAL